MGNSSIVHNPCGTRDERRGGGRDEENKTRKGAERLCELDKAPCLVTVGYERTECERNVVWLTQIGLSQSLSLAAPSVRLKRYL